MDISAIRIGCHVSIAGSISNSVGNALKIGCSTFQIFSRNPRGWIAKPIDKEEVKTFQSRLAKSKIRRDSVIVHMPYLPNLSSPNGDIYKKSEDALSEEVSRCSMLGITYLVIHLGSHLGRGAENGIYQLVKACNNAFDKLKSSNKVATPVMVLLENSAGQKNSIGSKFEELRTILDKLNSRQKFGVCLDTCHVFVSGYDLSTEVGVNKMIEHFDETVGLKELKLVHLNDSKGGLNSNLDRHEHIGLGKIGATGFTALFEHKQIMRLPLIMETPIDERRGDRENLKAVMDFIGASEQ
jgi:deoxyribonuclease IV